MSADRTHYRDNVPAARELRTRQTAAEATLWEALRGRRLAGLKFRRQHPIGPFVLDFCCPDRRLAIDLDGAVHTTQREYDAEREDLLRAAGYRVPRLTNEAIQDDLPATLATIRATAMSEPPRPAFPLARTAGWQ